MLRLCAVDGAFSPLPVCCSIVLPFIGSAIVCLLLQILYNKIKCYSSQDNIKEWPAVPQGFAAGAEKRDATVRLSPKARERSQVRYLRTLDALQLQLKVEEK